LLVNELGILVLIVFTTGDFPKYTLFLTVYPTSVADSEGEGKQTG